VRRVLLLFALIALAGCEDLRQFAGTWDGQVASDPQHRVGFEEGARLRAFVGGARRSQLDLALQLPGRGQLVDNPQACPGCVRFESIQHASDDVLGDVRLAGEPLRTYFGFVTPVGEPPFLAVVSLFGEDRVEVRLIRGAHDVYGVFYLARNK
jgi:hypothetical protein